MRLLIILTFAIFCINAQATTLKIASGEYAPYVGEHIPNQGITSMIVKAVFKEMKQDFVLDFMPWKRVTKAMDNGAVAGSFPWSLNDERFKKNYYSASIHQFRAIAFMKKGHDYKTLQSLTGKILCAPDGWDFAPLVPIVEKAKMQVLRPANTESCFNMLARERVDIIFMNDLVGRTIVEKVFGKTPPIIFGEREYLPKANNLYFIVSRKYPDGKKLIENFNHGLARIKANGVYDAIVSAKSICGTCNRLGSL